MCDTDKCVFRDLSISTRAHSSITGSLVAVFSAPSDSECLKKKFLSLSERERTAKLDICQGFTVNSSMIMSSLGKRHSIGSSEIKALS